MAYVMTIAGGWRLTYCGSGLEIPSRKARALLSYLVMSEARAHDREGLSQFLWEGAEPEQARASLRQLLVGLNRALQGGTPPLLVIRPDEILLNRAAISTDIDALLAAIDAGLNDDQDARTIGALPQLLFHDQGNIGNAFDQWRREVTTSLSERIHRKLALVFANPDMPRSNRMRAAQAALAMDDLDEAALRAIMTCHVEAGNAAAALRLYGDFYERLETGMDAEPSPETQNLAVAIKQGELGPKKQDQPATAASPPITVAVLPFEFLGPDGIADFVILGLLDQITCHLASFRAPAVISSNSTRLLRGRAISPADVRRDLRAGYVVSGSLLRQGGELLVSVQLTDTATNLILWAGRYRSAESALFDLRGSIAEGVAHAIVPSVDLAELRRARAMPAGTLEPYHLVLRAKDLIFELDQTAFGLAGNLLSEATRKDPEFAPAHALFAEWYALRLWQRWSDSYADDRAALEFHAARSIALSPGNGRALALLGHCRLMFERRHDDAQQMLDRAVSLFPNDSETLIWTVPTYAFSGREGEAVENASRAFDLSPLDPFRFRNEHFLSIAHFAAGDHDRAADLGLSAYRRAPNYTSNLRMTIAALERAGRRDEARPLVAHHMALTPDFSVSSFMLGHGYRRQEDRDRFAQSLIAAGLPE